MTKKKVGIIALIIIIISAVVMVFAYGIKNKQVVVSEDDKMKIVVTSFPQYDFARAVAGDKANIQMLIKPGVETHSYEPTPDDIQKIQNADLFIYTGGENDEWVEGILDSIDTSSLKTLKLEDCVDLIESNIPSTHSSFSPPVYINKSAFCIFCISSGVGSYECVSTPGFISICIFALSPATALAKSY